MWSPECKDVAALAHFIKKEIALPPLKGNNLWNFSLDPLDQDEITMIIFFCISINADF